MRILELGLAVRRIVFLVTYFNHPAAILRRFVRFEAKEMNRFVEGTNRCQQCTLGEKSMDMDFTGKVVIVTGGASGIGRACAREFAARHAAVAVVDRDVKNGEEAVAEIGTADVSAAYFNCDVTDAPQVQGLVSDIVSRFGGVDVVVNNAGIQRYGTVVTLSVTEWDEVIDANLKSAFLVSKYTIPAMLARGGGSIVITGSVQSAAAQRNSAHYVVSKHGLLGLARSIALDFGKQNIRANCVLPGAIDTPMLRWAANLDNNPERVLQACDSLHIRGRMGTAEEVARVIVFLASDLASFVTGAAINVDGGLLVPVGGMSFQEAGTGASKA